MISMANPIFSVKRRLWNTCKFKEGENKSLIVDFSKFFNGQGADASSIEIPNELLANDEIADQVDVISLSQIRVNTLLQQHDDLVDKLENIESEMKLLTGTGSIWSDDSGTIHTAIGILEQKIQYHKDTKAKKAYVYDSVFGSKDHDPELTLSKYDWLVHSVTPKRIYLRKIGESRTHIFHWNGFNPTNVTIQINIKQTFPDGVELYFNQTKRK